MVNKSQLGADDWVLSRYGSTPGFFLDVGCAQGEYISNTCKLEQHGWTGICIDAFPKNFHNRPKTTVVQAVVYSVKDKIVSFAIPTDPDLGGIVAELGQHKQEVMNSIKSMIDLKTELLQDILEKHGAPKFIEYMNLDIEGSEFEVLSVFPFNEYRFGCISIEHNYEEPKRTLIRELLTKNGYRFERDVKWDDWYVI